MEERLLAAAFSLTAIFQLQCGDAIGNDPAPCNIEAVDRNLRTPYISTWTLTVQRAITNDLSLEVAYVGNHGTKLLGFANINQPPLGSSYPGFGSADPTVNEVLCLQHDPADPAGFACDPERCKRGSVRSAAALQQVPVHRRGRPPVEPG